jgi:DNA-binding SARP family transcriptional activator
MRWRVLGPVGAWAHGEPLPVHRPQQRAVLAYLLLNANRVVSPEQLAEALWGGAPPPSARTQVQVCVSRLRQLARAAGAGELIVSEAGGYRIGAAEQDLDLTCFSALVNRAHELTRSGEPEPATVLLRQGLALWRGPALSGAAAAFVAPAAANLHEQRLGACEELFDAEFTLGRHGAAAAPLRELLAANPWREKLAAQLMTALARSGQQAEALRVYEEIRRRLGEELGVQPGARLAETHLLVLRQQLPPRGPALVSTVARPAQLPADLVSFTGRDSALTTLDLMLSRAQRSRATAVVAIVGTAGVGKTSLALRWAHRVRHLFGDGQLFLDLGGFSPGSPMQAEEALSRCLRALGVPPSRVPDDLEEAASLYRSELADRRVLIVLDNALDTAQLRPLLPGGAGCLVIATSRGGLDGLATRHDAQRLSLEVLGEAEAAGLLTGIIGAQRVAGQAEALAELAQACACLPLALRIAGADLHNRPHETVAGYVSRLRSGDRLAILAVREDEQFAVRCAFELSYQALPLGLQRLFRLFGLVPGCDVTADSAAAMLRCPPSQAAEMLSGLADAHLVQEKTLARFHTHDLLTLYATELTGTEDNSQTLKDFFSWYLAAAHRAVSLLCPQVLRLAPPSFPPADPPQRFATHVDALAWLDAHRLNLLTVIRQAAQQDRHEIVWHLADVLRGYFWLGMHTTEWSEAAQLGLSAAQAGQDEQAQAAARLSLGALKWRLEQFPGSITEYELALEGARRAGWPEGQAAALGNLGPVYRMSGRPAEALCVLEKALSLNESTGRIAGIAVNHNNLGLVCFDLGRLGEAAEHCRRALCLARQTNSAASQALALTNLGQAYHLLGRSDEAIQALTEALRLHEQTGSRGRAATLCTLAWVHADRADRPQATSLARQALALAQEPVEPRLEAMALHTLGRIGGDPRILARALSRARASGDRYIEADIIASHAELGERAALAWCHSALSIVRDCGYRVLEGRVQLARATAEHRAGDLTGARHSARAAWRLATGTGHQPGVERAEKLLARLDSHPPLD